MSESNMNESNMNDSIISDSIKSSVFVLASIILARFILPANITPILAMVVFLPRITDNRYLQSLLPIVLLFVTDFFLGFYGLTMCFVYGTLFLASLIARSYCDDSYLSLIKGSFWTVLLWHLLVNFGVYLSGLNSVSLLQTYIVAIPFDFRLLVSTLAFSSLFYGLKQVADLWAKQSSANLSNT